MRILVLCTGNSCRSQMALGWLRHQYGDSAEVFSAGSRPADVVNPLAIRAMSEVGIDISGEAPKHVNQFVGQSFDCVISVCDSAAEVCPAFPGKTVRYHQDFFDPANALGSEETRFAVYREVRDQIRAWLTKLSLDTSEDGTN